MIENKTFDEISIGDTASLTRTVTEEDINLYAAISGSINPIHFDAAYVKDAHQMDNVATHSMWVGTMVSNLLGNQLPGAGTVAKEQHFIFHNPIILGDTITMTITVREKKQKSHEIVFDCRCVKGDMLLVDGMVSVVAPKKRASLAPMLTPEYHVLRRKQAFEKMTDRAVAMGRIWVAVCYPCDYVSLSGAVEAAERGLINPLLVGPQKLIEKTAKDHNLNIAPYTIIDVQTEQESAAKSVALCRNGEAQALMKGSLHTDEMMREVARRETGLRTGRRISHVFIMDVPSYHKLLLVTDAAINILPEFEDKVDICQNAIGLAHALGVELPKVAILSAVETVYPKFPSTLDAAALCKMADRGQIKGAILDGPLAFDNAINLEAAQIKKITSPVCGDADILLVPNLEAGNMLSKQLLYLGGAELAGIVVGAKVPIILTSRADSVKARLASCAVAVLVAQVARKKAV